MGTKVDYLERRGQTDEWYMALINDRIREIGPLAKAEIVDLIRPYMPSGATERQCANKVDNLMRKMKREYGAEPIVLNGKRVWSLT